MGVDGGGLTVRRQAGAPDVVGRIATYRVARVLDVALSGERFDRPQDLDLGAYWTSIHLSARGRRSLPDDVPSEVCGRETRIGMCRPPEVAVTSRPRPPTGCFPRSALVRRTGPTAP